MKQLVRLWLALVALVAATAACQTAPVETVEDSMALVPYDIQFTAGVPSTRTAFTAPEGNVYPVIWTDSKKVKVFPDKFNEHATAAVSPSGDGSSAYFTARVNVTPASSYTFYLLSPDCVIANEKSSHCCYFNLPEVQQPTETSVSEDAMILVSKSNAVTSLTQTVSFSTVKHWTAYIKLSLTNLTAEIGELTGVELSADEPIAGYWSYQYDTEETAVYGSGSKRVEARTSSPTGIWFGIAPVDLGGKSLTVKAIGSEGTVSRTITLPEDKKFESGKIAIFTVDMKDATDPSAGEIYEHTTDVNQVTEGTKFVILTAVGDQYYALGTTQENGYRPGVPITLTPKTKSGEEEVVSDPAENVEVVTLEPGVSSGAWALRTKAGQYLALEKGKNGLYSIDEKTTLSDWRVRFDSNGVPEIRNNSQSTVYYLRYRKSDNHFMGIQQSMQGNLEPLSLFRNNNSGLENKLDPELRISKKSLDMKVGETFRVMVSVCNSQSDGGVVTFESRNPSVASVDAEGYVAALKPGQTTIFARVGETEHYRAGMDSCVVTIKAGDPDWIELAPGMKWATRNIGADWPEDPGDHIAWAESEPKDVYTWGTYKYATEDHYRSIFKYQIKDRRTNGCWFEKDPETGEFIFIGDGKPALEDYGYEDDAARQRWGGEWNIPSPAQVDWLRKNCTWTWDDENKGYVVTSQVSGYTANSIFLPAGGRSVADQVESVGQVGYYMSSQLSLGSTIHETVLDFDCNMRAFGNTYRYNGISVRPVYGRVPVSGIALEHETLTMESDEKVNLQIVFTPLYVSDPRVEWSTSNEVVVSIEGHTVQYVMLRAGKAGTATITAKTKDGGHVATCTVTVHGDEVAPDWVEMAYGLKWATFNVGARAPEEAGNYYAWAETEPKETYTWKNYKYLAPDNDFYYGINRYQVDDGQSHGMWYQLDDNTGTYRFIGDNSSAFVDFGDEDDVAKQTWGYEWRTPSGMQLQWLIDHCTWTWDAEKKGYLVTSNETGYTSNSIFLPAAGQMEDLETVQTGPNPVENGMSGYYMGNSLDGYTRHQQGLIFSGNGQFTVGNIQRRYGVTVRPVYGTVGVTSMSLAQNTLTVQSGTTTELKAVVKPAFASDPRVDWSTSDESVVSLVRRGATSCEFKALNSGVATITAKSRDGGLTSTCKVTVNAVPMEAVDLGLSVKWASKNIGAANPAAYGAYFAWGEVNPETGDHTGWDTYALGSGSDALSRYVVDPQYGTVDNWRRLYPEDDAARFNLGNNWRMPTRREYDELVDNCTISRKSLNGVLGFEVKGPNNATIFLPMGGMLQEYGMYDVTYASYFWTASLDDVDNDRAICGGMDIKNGPVSTYIGYPYRYIGLPIRPVDTSRDVPVSKYYISQTEANLNVGETLQLGLLHEPNDANLTDFVWSSSNPSVATVDAWGKVTAVKNGKATITASAYMSSASVSCEVTVGTAPVLKLQIAMSYNSNTWTDYTEPYQLGFISQEYFFRLYDTANDRFVTEGEFSKGSSFTAQGMTQADYDSSKPGTVFEVWGSNSWRVVLRTDGYMGVTLNYKNPDYGIDYRQTAVVYYPRPLALAKGSYAGEVVLNQEYLTAKVGKSFRLCFRHADKVRSEMVDGGYLLISGGDPSIAKVELDENSRELIVTPKKAGTTGYNIKYSRYGVTLNIKVYFIVSN